MVPSQCETNLLPETAGYFNCVRFAKKYFCWFVKVPLVNAASFPLHALYLSVILLYLFV